MHTLRKSILPALMCMFATTPVVAEAQVWTEWNLPRACPSANVTGALGATTVTVATTVGSVSAVQDKTGATCGGPIPNIGGGNNYWTPTAPYSPLPNNISFVQLNSAVQGTITFSQAVIDPYIALISVGRVGAWVSYVFDKSFTVVSNNKVDAAYWGTGNYGTDADVWYALNGEEFSGVLQFKGTFTSISFGTSLPGLEDWSGFTVGAPSVVPEPSTYALMAAGLAALGVIARRNRKA